MKTILVIGLLTLSSTAFSSVVKSYDSAKSCNLYRVVSETSKAKQNNETVIFDKAVYGLALEDLDVDFDNHQAKAQVIMNIIMGFNRPVVEGQLAIEEGNPQFKMLINQVNRKLSMLERVCISADKRIVYGKVMETK
ncbi:MAG: hypothetical protein H7336_10435 [Bacteriovorax sp.]|nr:hypothetical protein [Bacteriovorax sp.]